MTGKPRIENTPGLVWRRKKEGWEALWRARSDLVERGYPLKNKSLWIGLEPSETEKARISDTCVQLQDEMLNWGRGGTPKVSAFEGTIKSLVTCYQNDPLSTHKKKRYHVRKNHDITLRRMVERYGHVDLIDIKARTVLEWHAEWSDGGQKLAMAHMFVGMLRTMFAFGTTILEDEQCERLTGVMHHMRFPMPKPRTERLTLAQAHAIIAKAHEIGWFSIAAAQAFQFDLMLRQKDVIGEWVPLSEPGLSDYTDPVKGKWLRGLDWREIDDNFILRHVTSKREKPLEVDLRLAPLVMEQLQFIIKFLGKKPTKGPVIICEATALAWSMTEFRRKWRVVADLAGVPKSVRNMDSRAGAITEATEAGADLEHVKHAATHSDIAMTQRYSRAHIEKTAQVLQMRVKHRGQIK